MNPLALLILIGGGLALAAGSKKGASMTWVNFVGGDDNANAPLPPTQGNSFRMGPQPDPSAPGDPNRGRTFVVMEQSRQSGTVATGSVKLLDLSMAARGTIEVVVWATRAGKPHRCTRFTGKVNVADGRIVSAPALSLAMCGSAHATATDPGGCTLGLPFMQWEQQGPTIALVWRTKVSPGGMFSDNDCDEDLQFYVDAFWRWSPT